MRNIFCTNAIKISQIKTSEIFTNEQTSSWTKDLHIKSSLSRESIKHQWLMMNSFSTQTVKQILDFVLKTHLCDVSIISFHRRSWKTRMSDKNLAFRHFTVKRTRGTKLRNNIRNKRERLKILNTDKQFNNQQFDNLLQSQTVSWCCGYEHETHQFHCDSKYTSCSAVHVIYVQMLWFLYFIETCEMSGSRCYRAVATYHKSF